MLARPEIELPGYRVTDSLYTSPRTLVYRAVREADQATVAIKFLRQEYPSWSELVQFRNQYTLTHNLTFPGIVKSYSLEPHGNRYGLVMEDFGGLALREYVQAKSPDLVSPAPASSSASAAIQTAPLSIPDFLTIALQLGDILHELYCQRIIHKDINPANILIHPDSQQVKLIDFRIATLLPREAQAISPPQGLEGTLPYLSPEQTGRMNRGLDYRSDFYSLGVTFYQLLTGRLPFLDLDPLELVHCHLTQEPIAPSQLNPQVPPLLSEIVTKLMAKKAEDRYQSALGLKQDLDRCLTQWQVQASPLSPALLSVAPTGFVPSLPVPPASSGLSDGLDSDGLDSDGLDSDGLDLAALLKAAQSLASEMERGKLLATLLKLVIDTARADSCVLLLMQADRLFVEGQVTAGAEPVILQPIPVEQSQQLPLQVIDTVNRRLEAVVLTDAPDQTEFATDPYWLQHTPKSVLCSPILHQGKLLGMVYLENNRTIAAFTTDRISVLNILCAQAASALENAQLYQQTQQALEAAKLMKFSIDRASLSVFWIEPSAKIAYANDTACRELGYTPEEIVNKYVYEFDPNFPSETWPTHWQEFRRSESLTFETLHQTKAGVIYPVEITVNHLTFNGKEYNCAFVLNISDRKRAEAQLQEKELALRNIYEGVAQGIVVIEVTPDQDFYYMGWNLFIEKLTGILSSEVMGKTPEDLFGEIQGAVTRQNYQRCLALGTTISYEELIPVQGKEQWWLTTLNPLRHEAGHIDRLILTTIDISDRKAAETALRGSEQRFRDVTEAAGEYIWEIDANSIYTYVTEKSTQIKGYSPEQLLGRSPIEFMPPEDIAAVGKILAEAATRKGSFTLQHRDILPNGEVVWEEVSGLPLINAEGEIIGFRGTGLSITDRKAAEIAIQKKSQALEQALQDLQQAQLQMIQNEKMSALGNLVAGIAHEINNPVGFIAGNLKPALDYINDAFGLIDLYQQEYPQPSAKIREEIEAIDLDYVRMDLLKLIQSMNLGVQRIRDISTSLRTFSRADRDYKVQFNIHDGIDSTLLILKHRLKSVGDRPTIQVVKEYGQLPLVNCFPGQLNQVFMNILANAIDVLEDRLEAQRKPSAETTTETPTEPQFLPTIHIQTYLSTPDQVAIQITDNGIGMIEGIRQHVFDHLFTTKAVGKGTGLGLAIARQIVEETHGGHLSCTSQPLEGTQFMIKMPI